MRSLSEAVTKMEVQKQSIASEERECIPDCVAMVTPATPRRRLPDDRCPDATCEADWLPALEDNDAIRKLESTPCKLESLVEDNLDEVSASSPSSSPTSVKTGGKLGVSDFWRSPSANSSERPRNAFLEKLRYSKHPPTVLENDSTQDKGVQKTLLAERAIPVRIGNLHASPQAQPNVIPYTPTEHPDVQSGIRLLGSLDGTNERPSKHLLVNDDSKDTDQGLRIKRWVEQTPSHGSEEEHAYVSERLAARSRGFGSGPTPPILPSIAGTTKVGAPDCLDTLSEVQSETTTLLNDLRPTDEFLTDWGRPMAEPPGFERMSHNSLIRSHEPPWGYHRRIQYYRLNSQVPDRLGRDPTFLGQMQPSRPAVYPDIIGPQRRQHNPITVPMTILQRPGKLPSSSAHRHGPACYGTYTEIPCTLRYPDWTQDARRRLEIPKPPKEDERISMMNAYTRKYYGCQLDAARRLDHVERPKKEFDLGGLLP